MKKKPQLASISIGNRPLEGLSVGQTFKDMDSAWYIVTAAVATRGQKKKGRPKETRYRRITQGKGADGSGLTTTQCLPQLKDAEDVDIEVSEREASEVG